MTYLLDAETNLPLFIDMTLVGEVHDLGMLSRTVQVFEQGEDGVLHPRQGLHAVAGHPPRVEPDITLAQGTTWLHLVWQVQGFHPGIQVKAVARFGQEGHQVDILKPANLADTLAEPMISALHQVWVAVR